MGAHCGRHYHHEREIQDNVQQLSNTMLRMQMRNLGEESRAALDLRWLLESNASLQHEYLSRLQAGGHAIKYLLLNCICSNDLSPRERVLLNGLGLVLKTSLPNLKTLEFWHVCQSNLYRLNDILTQASQIKALRFEYGINHLGRDDLLFTDKLDLTGHVRLERLELVGFQDTHLQGFFESTLLPASLSTLILGCDIFTALGDLNENDDDEDADDADGLTDRTKLSLSTIHFIFRLPSLTQLGLNGISIQTPKVARAFCKMLQHSKIQSLSLLSCHLCEAIADSLVESMAHTFTLSRIHLTLDFADNHLSAYLQSFAKHLPNMAIKELHVGTYYDGDEDDFTHDDLMAFLIGVAQSKELAALSLPWTQGWTSSLSEAMGSVICHCKLLRKLSMCVFGDNADPEASSIVDATRRNSSLEIVDFVPFYPWSSVSRDAIEHICQKNRDCRINAERLCNLLQEPAERTRAAWFGTALSRTLDKKHVAFQSLVMAVNLVANGADSGVGQMQGAGRSST